MRIYLLLICVLWGFTAKAQSEFSAEKTYSPYFFVKTGDSSTDVLPLKKTTAKVQISGVIASVEIHQTYSNTGTKPLEALYIFPASTRAAVHQMEMKIGDRNLTAEIQEKQQARQTYEQAKADGKATSLLEQQRPNIFQMNVAGIMPNETVEIVLKYSELLVPEDGIYEFVYPTVVAPRYSEGQATPHEWVANPYRHAGELHEYAYDINLQIEGGMPVHNLKCTSHKVDSKIENNVNLVQLNKSEKYGGNKDFILQYQLADKTLTSGVLLHEGDDGENYFMCMVQPPASPVLAEIPPREYVFVLDVSGSMNGFPMQTAKTLLQDLIGKLRPTDRFNVLFFEGINRMFSPESVPATKKNIDLALDHIERHDGWGSTNLLPVLKTALNFKETQDYARTFIVVTDGFITLEKEAFDLIQNNLNKANLFAFGIGKSVNRYLIEGMSRAGQGVPFIVTKPEEASTKADQLRRCIQSPVLTNIQMEFQGLDAYDVEPKKLPDVMAGRPVLVFGKYKGKASGSLVLNGLSGKKNTSVNINFNQISDTKNEAVKLLWARNKITQLDDYELLTNNETDKNIQKEVAKLGVKYGLLSSQTSFVAVDNQTHQNAKNITVRQALPLAEGLSDNVMGQTSFSATRTPPGNARSTTRSTAPISIQLPPEVSSVLGDKIYLSWNTKSDKYKKFKITISNMSDEVLFQTESTSNELEIDLNQTKLTDTENLIFNVIPLDNAGNVVKDVDTEPKMLQKADEDEIAEIQAELKEKLGDKIGTERLLAEALFYEENEYLADAFRCFKTLLKTSENEAHKQEFQQFLKRNNL